MNEHKKAGEFSGAALSYLGDSVYEVLVRERIVSSEILERGHFSEEALRYVTAQAQSDALERILPDLLEDERDVFRRARNNYHTGNVPKSATPAQYRRSTGFEAIFGYLFLKGEFNRARELFSLAFPDTTEDNSDSAKMKGR